MANALSDLRYISRMGYQDPWAEATKNVTDSLLAYGQSKLKRDLLIAQFEDKQQDREDKKIKERISGNRFTFSQYENPEDALKFAENPTVAQDVFGPEGAIPGIEGLERKVSVNKELESYENVYKNPASTFLQSKDALIDARILATTNKLSGKSSGYGYELQRFQNKFVKDSNVEFLTNFAESGRDKWITGAEADQAISDLDEGKISQVQTTLNRAFSQKGTDLSYIESSYKNLLSRYDNAYKDSDGMWIDERAADQYKSLRTSLDNRFRGLLPIKYQDQRKSVEQNIQEARLRLDPVTGLPPKDDKLDDKKLKIEEPTTAVFNQRLLSPDSTGEKTDVSNISMVTIKNKIINKIETIPGSRAQDLINRGRAELVIGDEKSYVDVGSSIIPGESPVGEGAYVSRMQEELSYMSTDETKQRTPLRVGDEVIDKSSGKRKKITSVKVSDSPKERTASTGGYSAIKISEKYTYVVGGEKIKNYKDFQNRFAIPLWIKGKDSSIRPTVTGYSVTPVK